MKYFILAISISVLITPSTALAQSCPAKENSTFIIKEEWKNHFPFDLVYPPSQPDTDIDDITKCPKFIIFGVEKEVCSIPMVASVIKSIFLFKMGIKFLSED